MERLAVVLVLGSLVFAGCIGDGDGIDETLTPASVPGLDGVSAHRAGVLVPVPGSLTAIDIGLISTGQRGAEPTLGVASDGTIFVAGNGPNLIRSTDNGVSWQPVSTPTSDALTPKVSLDPWMWLDPATDRVFNAPLYVVCTWMAYSDDLGESWLASPHAGCGLPAHDHQKLTTGPPAQGVSTTGYESVLFYSYNSFRGEGTVVSTSLDGGLTWSLGSVAHVSDCHGGVAGPIAIASDGTAYSPKAACDGANVAVSRDSGQTWEVTGKIEDVGVQQALAVNPDVAIDTEDNAYLVYPAEDGRLFLSRSTDSGRSWSTPVQVSPPGITSTVFSVITAGEPGRLAIGYLGTTHDKQDWGEDGDPEDASDDTVWHAYMTLTENGLADEPTFVTHQLTPDDDPVQRGCVWQSGGGNPCRNLLDFIDMVQHEGRPYMVFADGCDRCERVEDSRGRALTLAVQQEGVSLVGELLAPLE